MKKSAWIAAVGAAALLTTAVGVLGAGAAAAADREYSTDGTRVTSVPAGHDWNNGTRVTSVPAGHPWDNAFPDDREY
jgi:hypothetical protein